MSNPDRYRGCLLGLAVGDAVGTTLEFKPRGTFEPISDMLGGGPFRLAPGQWTDDTSMALCLADSLVERSGFDADDQMRRYCRWQDEGYMSSTGRCFDIGTTTRQALDRYRATGNPYAGPTDPHSAGNGCIMRLAPVAIYFHGDPAATENHAAQSARTTHGAETCLDASRFFAGVLHRALDGRTKEEILAGGAERFSGCAEIEALAGGAYRRRDAEGVRGTGYVVDSLRAALWCFARTRTFAEAVLLAANLGDDADTTAAVCGQVAGAHYGERAIPPHWLDRLTMAVEIRDLADRLRAPRRRSRP